MSETTYTSKITSSKSSATTVYRALGNLSNLEHVMHLIPQDKVSDIEVTPDLIRFKVDGLGQKVGIRLVDREENSMLKFGVENMPLQANFWIQMKEAASGDTRLKLTLRCDIPVMFRMMLENKLKEGLDQAADMLAQMPFEQWDSND